MMNPIVSNVTNERYKQALRKHMLNVKRIIAYALYPGLVMITIVGVLQHTGSWCSVA